MDHATLILIILGGILFVAVLAFSQAALGILHRRFTGNPHILLSATRWEKWLIAAIWMALDALVISVIILFLFIAGALAGKLSLAPGIFIPLLFCYFIALLLGTRWRKRAFDRLSYQYRSIQRQIQQGKTPMRSFLGHRWLSWMFTPEQKQFYENGFARPPNKPDDG